METTRKEIVYVDREYDSWLRLCELLDRLGWTHYPENVTGEDIDAGDDSDVASEETIEVPFKDIPLFEFLDTQGVFDNI